MTQQQRPTPGCLVPVLLVIVGTIVAVSLHALGIIGTVKQVPISHHDAVIQACEKQWDQRSAELTSDGWTRHDWVNGICPQNMP